MYEIRLDDFTFPLAPSKITIDIKGQNATIDLLNGESISIPKTKGGTAIRFETFLPMTPYPLSNYGEEGFQYPSYYIRKINKIREGRRNINLLILKKDQRGKAIAEPIKFRVTIETYTTIERPEFGMDMLLQMTLKEYIEFKSKYINVNGKVVTSKPLRSLENKPKYTTHTVVKGDALWSIAQKYFKDGGKYKEFYEYNKELIDKRNNGTGNPTYTIYPGQVLQIPPEDFVATVERAKTIQFNSSSASGTEKSASTAANPTKTDNIPITSIALSRYSLDLLVDQRYNISATITPKNSTNQVEWYSNKRNIADISTTKNMPSSCTIVALSAGEAKVSAYSERVNNGCIVRIRNKNEYERVYEYKRLPGKDEDGEIAADMIYGKTSKPDLYKISLVLGDLANHYHQSLIIDGPEDLKDSFHDLARIFCIADSEMRAVAHDMIDHFLDGSGNDYRNDILTNRVLKHESTQKFINESKVNIIKALKKSKGDLNALKSDGELKEKINSVKPQYGKDEDMWNGLKICIHDTWGNFIDVKNYTFNGNTFSGTLKFTIYDHFGLDTSDVSGDLVGFISGYTKQFGSWYVLQHYEGCNELYKPFVTYIETEVNFIDWI